MNDKEESLVVIAVVILAVSAIAVVSWVVARFLTGS